VSLEPTTENAETQSWVMKY